MPAPRSRYGDLKSFGETLDCMGKGNKDSNFHSFRRFVKTTIFDLDYADYSNYFIGHSGSTYWTKKNSEKAEQRSNGDDKRTTIVIWEY